MGIHKLSANIVYLQIKCSLFVSQLSLSYQVNEAQLKIAHLSSKKSKI